MDNFRPIFRWTVGAASWAGLEILHESIVKAKRLYDPECYICFNHCSKRQRKFLSNISKKLEIKLINQQKIRLTIPDPIGECWKLVPPRINMEKHELFIDNDLVVFNKSPYIDKFLSKPSHTLILTARKRYYGQYSDCIPQWLKTNSGLFGIPPAFPFATKIRKFFCGKWIQDREKRWFDDQGIITLSLLDNDGPIVMVPEEDIINLEYHREFPHSQYNGIHFVNANRLKHMAWEEYKEVKLNKIYL